jgi:hypothetical protein
MKQIIGLTAKNWTKFRKIKINTKLFSKELIKELIILEN